MITLKTFAKNNFDSGVECGKPGVRGRGITKDLEKQDSNRHVVIKKRWDTRFTDFQGEYKFVLPPYKKRLGQRFSQS